MKPIDPVLGVLAALALFVLPGLLAVGRLRHGSGEDSEGRLRLDEALFLTVAVSVMASAWLAVLLAEAGRFAIGLAAAASFVAVSVLAIVARRRLASPFPAPDRGLLATLLVLAVALSLQARPSEYIVGGRDPGAYVAAMGVIARTGGIVYTDPAVLSVPAEDVELFFRNAERPDYSWSRFMGFDLERPTTGRVVPQFFHLFPAFGAYLFAAMGVKGALATPVVFGVLGTVGVFLALRRLLGLPTALLGALLLATNVVQVWFARYPVSEGVSQFLIFTALLAVALWEESGRGRFAVVAGSALGLSLLVRIDSVLLLAPLALYLGVRLLRGTLSVRAARPLLVPFALLGGHAGLHAAVFAPKYLHDIATRRYWNLGLLWLAVAAVVAAAAYAGYRLRARLAALLQTHGDRLRAALAVAVVVLATYACLLRPHLSAWAGADGNDPARMISNFGHLDQDRDGRLSADEFGKRSGGGVAFTRYDANRDGFLTTEEWRGDRPWILEELSFHRLAAHDAQALLRLGWFVTPLGLLLGVAGVAWLVWRSEAKLLFPLCTGLTFAAFYLYKIRVYNDYFFALRRFVPVILPLLLAGAAAALVALWTRGKLARVAAVLCGLLLFGGFARDTARIAKHVDWTGAVRFVSDVARRFGPDDIVVFEQPRSIHLLSLPLWSEYGTHILELARFNPDPDRLQHLLAAWRSRYHNTYFVHTYRTDLCGVFLQQVERHSFGTFEWERSYAGPPVKPEFQALHFTVSRVVPPEELQVPALPEVDLGGSDDFQVSGFFDKEAAGEVSYRWTGPCASVYLPGAKPGAELVVRAATLLRPDVPMVTVSLAGTPLGQFTAVHDWTDYRLRLPDPLPAGAPVLRFDVPSWRPANVMPGSDDIRDLGIMVDRLGVR